MRLKWRRELGGNSKSLPYLVFLLSLSATICAWVWAGVIVSATDRERFNYATEEAELAIQGRLEDQVDLLRSTAATFTLQQAWRHHQFSIYVSHIDLGANYKGVRGLGYLKVTPASKVSELVKAYRAEGVEGFTVHPAQSSGIQYPVAYFEPETATSREYAGFDAASDSVLRQAIENARDNGTPTVSGLTPFLQGQTRMGALQRGFILLYPVYQGGEVPATLEERQKQIIGLVFSPMRGSGLYQNVLEGEARRYLDVQIFDAPSKNESERLYSSLRNQANRNSAITVDTLYPILGRQWLLRFSTSAVFEQESASWLVRWILFAGTLVSLLLSTVSFVQVRANQRLSFQASELAKREAEVSQLNENLELLVHERTTDLRAANMELEAFCYSVSHDLRAPLRSVDGFSKALLEDYGERFDDQAFDYINRVRNASKRMDELISALLNLSRITRSEIGRQTIDLSQMAEEVIEDSLDEYPNADYKILIQPGITAEGDPKLVRVVLDNLFANALKFSYSSKNPTIEFGSIDDSFFVRDNGVGFNPEYADKLFVAFERLHTQKEFPGSGIGLATVQRIIQKHGGKVWADSQAGKGATFFFTLR